MRCLEDTFQQDEIGNIEIEVAQWRYGCCFLSYFNEFLRRLFTFDNHMQAS